MTSLASPLGFSLTLTPDGCAHIDGPGIVHVASGSELDHRGVVLDFLAAVDAKALEAEMLAPTTGPKLTTGPGAEALRALREMAEQW